MRYIITTTPKPRSAYGEYLRTGRWPPLEYKFNPNHDPHDGRFTFKAGGSGPAPGAKRKGHEPSGHKATAESRKKDEAKLDRAQQEREQALLTPDGLARAEAMRQSYEADRADLQAKLGVELPAMSMREAIIAQLYDEGRLPGQVTPEQLRAIMPAAGAKADAAARPLSEAMAHYGIIQPEQQAAFLAQVSEETGQLHDLEEKLKYSPERAMQVWPSRFPDLQTAERYVGDPEKLANYVYAERNGNGDEASGDGYRYRGRGMIQTTGRRNYDAVGHVADPDALAQPELAALSAAQYWSSKGLNDATAKPLSEGEFTAVVKKVNAGATGLSHRWKAYARALNVLRKTNRER